MAITVDVLHELLSFDGDTGVLIWKERDSRHCASALSAKRWNARFAGKPAITGNHAQGYLEGTILFKKVLAHRAAWAMHYGRWPPNQIDHINGDRSDNRIANLREATTTENNRNMRRSSRNTSGTVGVHRSKRLWVARICEQGKIVHLGSFAEQSDAVAARKAAELRFGYHANHGRAE